MTTPLGFLERNPLIEVFKLRYPGPNIPNLAHPDHVVPPTITSAASFSGTGVRYFYTTLRTGLRVQLLLHRSFTNGRAYRRVFCNRLKPIYEAEFMSIVPRNDRF